MINRHDLNHIAGALVTLYEEPGSAIPRAYNERGMLRWLHTAGLGMSKIVDLRLEYDSVGRLVYQIQYGPSLFDMYLYDRGGRLT